MITCHFPDTVTSTRAVPTAGCLGMERFTRFTIVASSLRKGTKVRRYNWSSAGSLGWPFPMPKYKYIFQIKTYGSNFIKQHSETFMV